MEIIHRKTYVEQWGSSLEDITKFVYTEKYEIHMINQPFKFMTNGKNQI
jgi:hypothetical protein